jgi:SAM-dependent methyltransferase
MRWGDAEAAWYADAIAATDYASAVLRCLPGPFGDLLDIGAGSGVLAAGVLGRGARWRAVEPQALMRQRLRQRAESLADRAVVLELHGCGWEALAPDVRAEVLLAANLGVTHHDAAAFHDAMHARWRRSMHWVVPAQPGPSTFCLAGFLPPELHGAEMQPAYERTLAQLGTGRAPDRIAYADWRFDARFANAEAATGHCCDRLGIAADSARVRAVAAWVHAHGVADARGFVIGCAKRSAVLSWGEP